MALIPTFIKRPSAILKMPNAIMRGLSATGFLRELQGMGLSYRKTLFLSDWRSVSGVEAKKNLIQYVRKDRIPSARLVPDVEWELSREYMHKVKVWSRLKPDEPLTERFVNIMSDNPMSPLEIEAQVESMWGQWEKYAQESLEGMKVVTTYHRIETPLE